MLIYPYDKFHKSCDKELTLKLLRSLFEIRTTDITRSLYILAIGRLALTIMKPLSSFPTIRIDARIFSVFEYYIVVALGSALFSSPKDKAQGRLLLCIEDEQIGICGSLQMPAPPWCC
jgi:hypothetical protein